MEDLDVDLESLERRLDGASVRRARRHALILVLTAAVGLCILLDRHGPAATQRHGRDELTALQDKYATDWRL